MELCCVHADSRLDFPDTRLLSDVFKHDLRKFNDRQQLMVEREKIVYVVTMYYAKNQIE